MIHEITSLIGGFDAYHGLPRCLSKIFWIMVNRCFNHARNFLADIDNSSVEADNFGLGI